MASSTPRDCTCLHGVALAAAEAAAHSTDSLLSCCHTHARALSQTPIICIQSTFDSIIRPNVKMLFSLSFSPNRMHIEYSVQPKLWFYLVLMIDEPLYSTLHELASLFVCRL